LCFLNPTQKNFVQNLMSRLVMSTCISPSTIGVEVYFLGCIISVCSRSLHGIMVLLCFILQSLGSLSVSQCIFLVITFITAMLSILGVQHFYFALYHCHVDYFRFTVLYRRRTEYFMCIALCCNSALYHCHADYFWFVSFTVCSHRCS
jgi:hypothetical protein